MSDRELANRVREAVTAYNAVIEEFSVKLEAARQAGIKVASEASAAGLLVHGCDGMYGRGGGFGALIHIERMHPPRIKREVEV